MGFTDEQRRAIELRDKNLLLSAAAGSGKTTVLVERIIGRILDEDNPVDVDRLLVCTFTKAAAEQMKDKIFRAIEERRIADPYNKHLIKQASLIHNAHITTIHGFCLEVIRNHFHEIGLNPDFRVGDEGECSLMRNDALELVLENAYKEGRESFVITSESIASKKDDRSLPPVIERLYNLAVSNPYPELWLESCLEPFEVENYEEFGGLEFVRYLISYVKASFEDALKSAKNAYEICCDIDGPYMYKEAFDSDIEFLENMCELSAYDEYYNVLKGLAFKTLGRAKKNGPYVDVDIQNRVKNIRESYKKGITAIASEIFGKSLLEQFVLMKKTYPIACELVKLTIEMKNRYSEMKRRKNIVDFNDLEHFCIEILESSNSETANEYRNYFEEIYVDEYQDSNLVQEKMLTLICRRNNMFMVGDVKQSIYKFRMARPELFMEKYDSFSDSDGENIRIDLHHNFRSRESVLDSVNELFYKIMSKENGGIDYDKKAALYAGLKFPPVSDKFKKTELLLVNKEDGINSKELEAKAIAFRIKRMFADGQEVTDESGESLRALKYSDIVILLRSASGYDEIFKRILSAEGIPVDVVSATGYFSAREVSVLLDYLKIIDNPKQDIPLTACLRSYFGGFSNSELVFVVKIKENAELYEKLKFIANASKEEIETAGKEFPDAFDFGKIQVKVRTFLEELDRWRQRVPYTPIYEILNEIIDGNYGLSVLSEKNGEKKYANLNMLLKKARDFSETSFKGLFHFVRYIEVLHKYDIDYGEANVSSADSDAVKIMTIHKSKGLEFPICFIAGMNKKYNFSDKDGLVVPDMDYGLGIDYIDLDKRIKEKTLLEIVNSRKIVDESCNEEQRILYVAMTRAKEKLIMTGVVKEAEEYFTKAKNLSKCISYLDLFSYANSIEELKNVAVNTVSISSLVEAEVSEGINLELNRLQIENILCGKESVPLSEFLIERMNYSYLHENDADVCRKISVTELKKRSMHVPVSENDLPEDSVQLIKTERETRIPKFLEKKIEKLPANVHGTAVHRAFELWDYNEDCDFKSIEGFLAKTSKDGRLEETLAADIKVHEIADFLNSDIARRMKAAFMRGELKREQPFVFETEGMLVQGIIDAFFLEDDEIVIVDYKTDRVGSVSELADRYKVQLEYYGKALSRILERKVKELVIYSTYHKKTVIINSTVIN